MAIVTPEQYFSNEDNHGNYQWVTLKDIVDAVLIETQDEDSYLKNTPRHKILYHAKQGVKEVNKEAANQVLSVEVTVPNSLAFPLMQDFVEYVRVSVVVIDEATGSRRLQPLDVNHNINISTGYLQDNDAEILFDEDGYILTSDGDNAYGMPYKKYLFTESGSQFRLDTSKLSEYGEFTIDKERGKILFSSELMDKEVVIEYVSDGLTAQLTETQVKVHKYLEMTIKDWIYYACIALKRNVPANEKKRALDRYKTTLHQAKLDLSDLNMLQIARMVRTKSMP